MPQEDAWHIQRAWSGSISLLGVRNFHCQPSSVVSYHGLATSAITIRCQKSYLREQQMAVVAEEDRVSHGGQHRRMHRPVVVVITAHHRRQTSKGSHCSGGLCQCSIEIRVFPTNITTIAQGRYSLLSIVQMLTNCALYVHINYL